MAIDETRHGKVQVFIYYDLAKSFMPKCLHVSVLQWGWNILQCCVLQGSSAVYHVNPADGHYVKRKQKVTQHIYKSIHATRKMVQYANIYVCISAYIYVCVWSWRVLFLALCYLLFKQKNEQTCLFFQNVYKDWISKFYLLRIFILRPIYFTYVTHL